MPPPPARAASTIPIATPLHASQPALVGATSLPDDAEIDISIDGLTGMDTPASAHFEDISLDDISAPRPPPPPRGGRESAASDFALPASRSQAAGAATTAPAGSSSPPAGALVTPPPAAAGARRNDSASLYAMLKAQLDHLPLDAVDRITELRQRLGDLAHRLRDDMAAASYYELVLAQHPERIEVLRPLVDIYTATGEWDRCAEVMGRLAYLARTSEERAEWTYRQAEILRHHLHDEEGASAGYLRAADYHPEHAPTLRRLIAFYFAEGEIGSLLEVLAELERQGEPIGDSVVEAGLGLIVAGEEGRGAPLVAGADARRLAEVLASIRIDDPRYIDQALRAAGRALLGLQPAAREASAARDDAAALSKAIEAFLVEDPSRIGARMAAARLAERMEDIARARAHLAVLAWVDPEGDAARRMAELPEPMLSPEPTEPVHPAARGPLREALRLLGPLTVGVGAPMPGAEPNPTWAARLFPLATVFGFEQIDAAVVEEQGEPVWAEPTAPARLLIRRDMLADEPAVEFGAARALHLLRAGVPVVDERAEEDLAALLSAAAALFDPALKIENPLEQAWLAALRSLPFHPEAMPAERRDALSRALRSCAEPGVAASGPLFCRAERFTADRVAFALGGDVGAALRALVPDATSHYVGKRARAVLLSAHDPVRELLAYVFSHEGLRRLGEDD